MDILLTTEQDITSSWDYNQYFIFGAVFLIALVIIEEQEAIRCALMRLKMKRTSNDDEKILSARNLKKTFYKVPCQNLFCCIWFCCPIRVLRKFGRVKANKDISLEVGYNESRALVGLNGSGKTTLFDLITNKTKPTSGKILMNQIPLEKYLY